MKHAHICRTAGLLILLLNSGLAAASQSIYIARRGWHIDVGMAVEDLTEPLKSVVAQVPDARFAFFGFGDRHYLLAAHHRAPAMLSALFPGAGVTLLTGIANNPQQAFGEEQVIALQLDPSQMASLQNFILGSLRQSAQMQGPSIASYREGPYEGSAFFLATAKYSAFHTCNTWGAEALRAAGFKVHVKGVLFAHQLWVQARRLRRAQDRAQIAGASLLTGGAVPSS